MSPNELKFIGAALMLIAVLALLGIAALTSFGYGLLALVACACVALGTFTLCLSATEKEATNG